MWKLIQMVFIISIVSVYVLARNLIHKKMYVIEDAKWFYN